jgi:5-formyltetrahydrofolate cyclo-ligase
LPVFKKGCCVPDFAGEAEKSRSAKVALRNRLLAVRKSMTTSDRRSAAASVQAVLLSLVRAQHPSTIAAYQPVGSEPGGEDLPSVLLEALPPGGRLLLPVLLNDGDLDWATYSGSLEPGPRGLRQPVGVRLGVAAVSAASLVIVPALAVDRAGLRLGRGGGSYDRALSRIALPAASAHSSPVESPSVPSRPAAVAGPFIVALLHNGELVDDVPAEAHDRPVHAAITPGGGLTLSQIAEWTN